jgi:myo-inositol catabolism protein IolS
LKQLAQVEPWKRLARPDRSLVQIALAWTLANPAVTCAIPGAKNVEQIRSNAAAADITLTEDELAVLNAG